jgi:hypothetical protein
MPFDYSDLVRHLTQNGQDALPPVDVQRMATIAGYDPAFDDGDGGTYPAVSVYLAGSDVPTPGCRFASHYTPTLGEMVIVTQTGTDAYVLGSLSGSIKQIAGTQITTKIGGAISVVAHQTLSIGTAAKPLGFQGINTVKTSGGYFTVTGASLVAPVLPNRLYKAEVTATYTVSLGVASYSPTVSLAVYAPVTGWMSFGSGGSTNGITTTNGSIIASDEPATALTKGQWATKYPNNTFTWQLGVSTAASNTAYAPGVQFNSPNNVQFTIYDMGPSA